MGFKILLLSYYFRAILLFSTSQLSNKQKFIKMLPYGKITILDGKTIISRPEIIGDGYDEKLKKALAAMYAATGVDLNMYFASGRYSHSAIGDFLDRVMDIVSAEYPRGKSVAEVFIYAERAAYKYVKDKWRF